VYKGLSKQAAKKHVQAKQTLYFK